MSADRFSLPSRVSADRSPTRRDVLKSGAALAAASVAAPLGVPGLFSNAFAAPSKRSTLPTPRYDKLPRWRGFNLLEKFMVYDNKPIREDDFRNIADLG
ncbi:MAG: twin-arginine translocation signal domain-containing protein, partial [Thermoguttaceae bacterium]|nr:twin-arginine translocation signal domain-containing protein [Thermoguttaceae bacterium]